jgi:molybdopterin converting factor small subunit
MSAANVEPLRPNARKLGLWAVLVVLGAFVAYAAQREMRKPAPDVQPQAIHAFAEQRPARSAAEERFAQALWNVHADVRTAAVRMTFAGLAYKMGDGDVAGIQAKVAPLTAVFRQAESDLRAIDTPAAMQELRDRYIGALQLYGGASQEMVKVARDGQETHLLKAQEMSERASGVLLDVGEQLWPGEIKPN